MRIPVHLAAPLLLAACGAPGATEPDSSETRFQDIRDGDDAPVRAWFDAHADFPRAILLLSPV